MENFLWFDWSQKGINLLEVNFFMIDSNESLRFLMKNKETVTIEDKRDIQNFKMNILKTDAGRMELC